METPSISSYQDIVSVYDRLLQDRTLPLFHETTLLPKRVLPVAKTGGLRVAIFSPHPDDESIIGGLPLRLMEEGAVVTNIAVTLGSDISRQVPRQEELKRACTYLGFSCSVLKGMGLKSLSLQTRIAERLVWASYIAVMQECIMALRPDIMIFPHQEDAHPTHQGTHALVMDALKALHYPCWVVQSEFWQPMFQPNLMVASSNQDVADLMIALACHVGEVKRNPYHLRLPAWMADNVRRGAEIIQGCGSLPPTYSFATLYRFDRWNGECFLENKASFMLSTETSVASIFI